MADKLVTLAAFGDSLQSELAKAKLEADGIECIVTEDATHSLFGYATGAIKLQVKKSDSEKASEILKRDE